MTQADDNLTQYAEYNKTLRAWFVGFGFGAPATFIINDGAQKLLLASPQAKLIIWLFVIGASAQVLMAFINKTVSWCAYYKHAHRHIDKNRPLICWAAGFEDSFWIDAAFDLLSLFTFGWSIKLMIGLY